MMAGAQGWEVTSKAIFGVQWAKLLLEGSGTSWHSFCFTLKGYLLGQTLQKYSAMLFCAMKVKQEKQRALSRCVFVFSVTEILHLTVCQAGHQHQSQWSQQKRQEDRWRQYWDVLRAYTPTFENIAIDCYIHLEFFEGTVIVCPAFTYVHVSDGPSWSSSSVSVGLHEDVIVTRQQILQGVTVSVTRHTQSCVNKSREQVQRRQNVFCL